MIVWANLDCEARWAGVTLPQHVLTRISTVSLALVALVPENEKLVELWTPAAVDADRAKGITVKVGTPPRYDLAWANPDAKEVNDRWFSLRLAQQLGVALPGARVIASMAELDEHLATLGDRRWVVKARWTAAGRDRAYGTGPLDPAAGPRVAETRIYVSRLVERGGVVVEPWMTRLSDFGVCGHVSRDGTIANPMLHTLLVDDRGGFLGIDLDGPHWLTEEHHATIDRVGREVGRALHLASYAGPYTIDGFVYRDGDERKLQPMCELNARYTFGHVARAFARDGFQHLWFGKPPENAIALPLVENAVWIG